MNFTRTICIPIERRNRHAVLMQCRLHGNSFGIASGNGCGLCSKKLVAAVKILPTRGNFHDLSGAITYKCEIITLFLENYRKDAVHYAIRIGTYEQVIHICACIVGKGTVYKINALATKDMNIPRSAIATVVCKEAVIKDHQLAGFSSMSLV